MRSLLLLPFALALLAVVPTPPPAHAPLAAPFAAPAAPGRKREAVDDAIDRGLEFLRTSQNRDGSWGNPAGVPWGGGAFGRPGNNGGAGTGDLAITSLAVMAFLSAGHVPGEGHYGEVVERGVEWVVSHQQADGKLVPQNLPTEMYHHGICTLMLAEVVGLTRQENADRLRGALEKAVKVILAGQRKGDGRGQASAAGGWRYAVLPNGPFGADADLSVTGWQLMALRAAKNVGCDVPAASIKAAVEYVLRSVDRRGGQFDAKDGVGFCYQPGGGVTVPCTGVGVLCLELSGKEYHLCDEVLRGGAYLLSDRHQLRAGEAHFFYGVYYVSQVMFQLGGNYWESYRPKLHRLLLRDAAPENSGGWLRGGGDAAGYGSSYSTSMAILALTVEYRYLPIYQRFEEPLERDGKE
jgi:hypothetical protein